MHDTLPHDARSSRDKPSDGLAADRMDALPPEIGSGYVTELADALAKANDGDFLVRARCGSTTNRDRVFEVTEEVLLVVSKYQVIAHLAATPGWAERVARAELEVDDIESGELELDTKPVDEVLRLIKERMGQPASP